jgi:selenocysteine-specific elongation factor
MENPIVAERQERFIIRGFSSMRLLGGGQLVDVYPQRHRRFRANVLRHLERIAGAGPAELVEETLLNTYGEQQVQSLHSLVQHTNLPQQTVRNEVEKLTAPGSVKGFANDLFMHRERYDRLLRDMVDQIQTLHRSNRLRETVHRDSIRARLSCPIPDVVFDSALRDLVQEGAVIQTGHEIRHPEHRITLTPQEKKMLEAVDQLGKEATLQILTLSDLPRLAPDMRPDAMKGIIAYLFEQGLLVEFADKQIMHRDALERVKNRLIAYLREHETVRAAEFRDYLDISRAHATALLDHFCDRGVTRRESGTHRLRISP